MTEGQFVVIKNRGKKVVKSIALPIETIERLNKHALLSNAESMSSLIRTAICFYLDSHANNHKVDSDIKNPSVEMTQQMMDSLFDDD